MKKTFLILTSIFTLNINNLLSYSYPVSSINPNATSPINTQQSIWGTFGEVRKKGNILRDHFHTGVDIAGQEGSRVYTVIDSTVGIIKERGSINERIWIGRFEYVHINISDEIVEISKRSNAEERFINSGTFIGTTNNQNHVHLIESYNGVFINPLRQGGLSPFVDTASPTIKTIQVVSDYDPLNDKIPDEFDKEDSTYIVKGKIDIIADCVDGITLGTSNAGIYEIGYEIFKATDLQNPLISEMTNIRFNRLPPNNKTKIVYAEGTDIQSSPHTNKYIVTNSTAGNSYFDTGELEPGKYRIYVIARDSNGNECKKSVDIDVVEEKPPWQMFRNDAQHTGRSKFKGPQQSPQAKWAFVSGNSGSPTSPVLDNNGTIYEAFFRTIFAVNSTGEMEWSYTLNIHGNLHPQTLSLWKDTLYCITDHPYKLYALNTQTGELKWTYEFPTGVRGNLCIEKDGTIYLKAEESLYAINSDGNLKWKVATGLGISYFAVGNDGTIYVSGYRDTTRTKSDLYAYYPDGQLKWSKYISIYSYSIAIGDDNTIYLCYFYGNYLTNLCALTQSGAVKWEYPVGQGANFYLPPCISRDGKILLSQSVYPYTYAFNPDGSIAWTYSNVVDKSYNFSVGADGVIYFTDSMRLYALNLNGTLKWKLDGKFNGTDLPINKDGTIYASSYPNNVLYAFADSTLVSSNEETLKKHIGVIKLTVDPIFKLGEVYSYPNPAKRGKWPMIHIECGIADWVEIRIYDTAGKLIDSTEIREQPLIINEKYAYEYFWNVSDVASGVYICTVSAYKSGEKTIKVLKKIAVIK
ncbi:MAG: PQQ-binding-like beta-propeller repeat protein [Elusimicrobia bacterium]|nr:PQQ-binding-like beta-propeller repeat protein [Elusimicrobiota bacterium]